MRCIVLRQRSGPMLTKCTDILQMGTKGLVQTSTLINTIKLDVCRQSWNAEEQGNEQAHQIKTFVTLCSEIPPPPPLPPKMRQSTANDNDCVVARSPYNPSSAWSQQITDHLGLYLFKLLLDDLCRASVLSQADLILIPS